MFPSCCLVHHNQNMLPMSVHSGSTRLHVSPGEPEIVALHGTGDIRQAASCPACHCDQSWCSHRDHKQVQCALPTQKLNPVPKKGVAILTPTICEIVSPVIWS